MTRHQRLKFRCVRLAAAALAVGMFASAGLAPVSAQDATPDASPAAVECVSPGLPPGTPTPMDEMGDMEMGTPVGETEESSTPIAVAEEEVDVTGTEADEATAAAVTASIENYAACFNAGHASGDPGLFVALETDNYIATSGYATPWDRAAGELGSPINQATILEVDDAMIWDDGRVSGDVQVMLGDHWYNHWRVFLVEEDGTWLWDQEASLPPTPDVDFVAVNGINITETTDEATGEITYAFVSLGGSWDFPATDAIVFNFTNSGAEPHEAILAQVPEGADPMGILDGSIPFEEVSFLGGVFFIPPDGAADMTMVGLEPGTYTLICFFPSADGAPHAVHGMIQQFNIVEPAA